MSNIMTNETKKESTRKYFKRGYGYNVHCNSYVLYKDENNKVVAEKLDKVPKWINLLSRYDGYEPTHSILDKFMRSPLVYDPFSPTLVDLTAKDVEPMLMILHKTDDPSNKMVCYAERTYIAKINSHAGDLSTCIPLVYDEEDKRVVLQNEFFFISSKKFPNDRYSIQHGGVWLNYKLLRGWEIETIITLFDVEEAAKKPKTLYHEMYPQK